MVAAAGLKHPRDLQPHHLSFRSGPEAHSTLDRIHSFLPAGALVDAPQETVYADWWAAARADSFDPAFNLAEQRARASSDPQPNSN